MESCYLKKNIELRIHFYMETLYSFLIASIALTLSPGPDIFLVLSESLAKGVKSGILLSAGLVCGLPFHTLLLVLGWVQFIEFYPDLVYLVKIAGTLYFIFLSVQTFRNLSVEKTSEVLKEDNSLKTFKKGFLMNLLNPKVTLFFWLFFPGFLFHDTLSDAYQYAVLGIVFMLQALVIFSIVSLTSAFITSSLLTKPKVRYWMNIVQGIILICIALYLLF